MATLLSGSVRIPRRQLDAYARRFQANSTRAQIFLLSASMGAGHDGAAREISQRLQAMGYTTALRDFLESGPLRIGPALRRSYGLQLRYFPRTYETTYRMWFKAPGLRAPLARFVAMLTGSTLLDWIGDADPLVVVSTYPLATLALGELKRTGKLSVPVVNFITDFGVHPLWVHPGVDLNLAVHEIPAASAASRSGRPSTACGPAVSDDFRADRLPPRTEARARLGIEWVEPVVLIAAGSWGVGAVEETVRTVASGGRFVPVVACGTDRRLRRRLERVVARRGIRAVVIGWTDDMPAVVAACDAIVENAGGLTGFEAMRAGVPVVSYRPIPGHGRENSAAMSDAGVVKVARDAAELVVLLDALTVHGPARTAQVSAGAKIFAGDPAQLVADMVPAGARRRSGTPA